MRDARLQNYLLWLEERGQRLPSEVCYNCGYVTPSDASHWLCYRFLQAEEQTLLNKYGSIWQQFQLVPLRSCVDKHLCQKQKRDLQRLQSLVLLGVEAARFILQGRCVRFSSQRGACFRDAAWCGVRLLLTFHPRDVLRYPANGGYWQQDFLQALSGLDNYA